MSTTVRTIEIDAETAAIVDRRAAEQGVSASELIADLVSRNDEAVIASATDIAELDRRWAAIQQGEPTVNDEDVRRWMKTWGTASFEPWPRVR